MDKPAPAPPADELRAKLIREFDDHPSEWVFPNEFGGYDVDNAAAADLALEVLGPELEEGRFAIAHIEQWQRVVEANKTEIARLTGLLRGMARKVVASRAELHQAVEDWARNDASVLADSQQVATRNEYLQRLLVWERKCWGIERQGWRELHERTVAEASISSIPDDALAQLVHMLANRARTLPGLEYDEHQHAAAALLDRFRSWQTTNTTTSGAHLQGSSNWLQRLEQAPVEPGSLQPLRHVVSYKRHEAGWCAVCSGCLTHEHGPEQQVRDWGGQHEADALRPASDTTRPPSASPSTRQEG
ncbi:hypothetical protein [Umezawaea tangerina]|uniref:Uncharacterized protein n=1 Tax=Umezawaea tangerina TaxID=84725 RepID=A0A2T0SPH6_9PSEU|nr:hypothetical protein [Umezawaea tangerina]PRY35308.1 hypothetical protein CLV43_114226 [Umezawaea tangerina]